MPRLFCFYVTGLNGVNQVVLMIAYIVWMLGLTFPQKWILSAHIVETDQQLNHPKERLAKLYGQRYWARPPNVISATSV